MMTEDTFRVPENNLPELEARIAKLARRAAKLGLTPPALVIEGYEDVPLVRLPNGVTVERKTLKPEDAVVGYRRYHAVRLTGEAPVLPGWALVAVIEHGNTEIGNVLRAAPGMECPPAYRQAGPLCQHCGRVRYRLETFVLRDPDGKYKQVGRNCLADFCRDPEAAAELCSYAEILESARGLCSGAEDEDFFGFGGRAIQRAEVESVLAVTARFIRGRGWLSRSKAGDGPGSRPTADLVSDVFFVQRLEDQHQELVAMARDIEERDRELATAALAWIRSKRPEAETLNDYLYNCLVVASEETAQRKHFGVLCSIVAAYQREKDQAEQLARAAKASTHQGTVGERRGFTGLTCKVLRHFESQYGVKTMCRFEDAVGNVMVWWASGDISWLEEGGQYDVTATVKKHGEYRGVPQTELTRVSQGIKAKEKRRKPNVAAA